jgi:hypothetical protein
VDGWEMEGGGRITGMESERCRVGMEEGEGGDF